MLDYNNETSELRYENGDIVVPQNEFKEWQPFSKMDAGKRELTKIKIQLGLKCNYSSEYCSQRFVPRNPDDNYNFVDRKGLSRELARMILPLNNYTEVYWKCNLHNFFHLIDLRSDSHAQWEIQELSKAMYDLVKPRFPLACKAFEDYIMYGVNLSRSEVNVVKELIRSVEDSGIDVTDLVEKEIKSPRESKEFLNKF